MAQPKRHLSLLIKGLMMGTADIIPGVSGGTLALITGIYHELVASIRSIGVKTILAPFLLALPNRRSEAMAELKAINWAFLIPLGLGIVTAILALSRVIPWLLENEPTAMYSLFFGLIIASVIFPWRLVETRGPELGLAVAGGLIAFSIAGTEQLAQGSLHPLYVFACGAIAITAMILPGISGSYILVILGEYKLILEAIHNRDLITVGIFMAGIVVGILSFSRVLNWLLEHHQSVTMAVLAGFMIGSLRKVWPPQYWEPGQSFAETWVASTAFVIIGAVVVLGLDFWSSRQNPQAPTL